MRDGKKAEEIAVLRFQLLSPLLEDGLDPAKLRGMKVQICAQTGLSERTLRRYLRDYHKDGLGGLKPKGKGRTNPACTSVPDELLDAAIGLRREVPSRSVSQIIQILEWEGKAHQGQIKRSTLQEKFAERGYSSRQMRMYTQSGVAARRFQKRHRNQLWQSDIKFGPYVFIDNSGNKVQAYLVAFIDDATRFVLHGAFYATLDKRIVIDCMRQAMQKYGMPDALYFDNGKQFRTKWMARTCSKLGIRLLYAAPYSAESKGKIERLNQTIDSFLAEFALEKEPTLERLNELFQVWLSECYQNKPHSALGESTSPQMAYQKDPKPLRFVSAEVMADAFLHLETRKVDKSGCISFQNKKYEVGLSFIGRTVDVVYDPTDTTVLTIEHPGHEPWTAREMVIGERSGKRPSMPEHLGTLPAESSRLLAAATDKHKDRIDQITPAVRYDRVWKEGEGHV